MEKKEPIKMSLWSFYVMAAGIVILLSAVVIGGINVYKANIGQQTSIVSKYNR